MFSRTHGQTVVLVLFTSPLSWGGAMSEVNRICTILEKERKEGGVVFKSFNSPAVNYSQICKS